MEQLGTTVLHLGTHVPRKNQDSQQATSAPDSATPSHRIYDRAFLLAYISNLFMMTAVSLLFRYDDFVRLHGGTELQLGLIVGVGTLGAIACRIFLGGLIDRFGPGRLWQFSILAMVAALAWHLTLTRVEGAPVYLARTLYASGMAGVFGSWMTFVTLRVPAHRVAEAIGVVGSSGFAGMALGPILGDWVFHAGHTPTVQVEWMFWLAAGLHMASGIFAHLACRADGLAPPVRHPEPEETRSFLALVRLRHPLALTLVAIALGINNSLPGTFIRPMTHRLGIDSLTWYFLTYNVVAFSFRLVLRRAYEEFGLRQMIVIGMLVVVGSMFSYLMVTTPISLIVPAIAAGLAHAILYPAVVASGTALYPRRMRGAATNLMLATYDVGVLIGAPAVGWLISRARRLQLPDYPTMFCVVGGVNLLVVIIYWWRTRE